MENLTENSLERFSLPLTVVDNVENDQLANLISSAEGIIPPDIDQVKASLDDLLLLPQVEGLIPDSPGENSLENESQDPLIGDINIEPRNLQGDIIYVDQTAQGNNSGNSWNNAYTNLQSAIDVADAGDEIWVATGFYTPTDGIDPTISFELKNQVEIYGGFEGDETALSQRDWEKNLTVLSGDIGIVGDSGDNSFHVINNENINSSAILDGFTISDGNANGFTEGNQTGGGMLNLASDPTLVNLSFFNNSASLSGGAMSNLQSNPTLTNVSFNVNFTDNPEVDGVDSGGAMSNIQSNPTLTNVSFALNSATNAGGAMSNLESNPILNNVIFDSNFTTDEEFTSGGGAIVNIDSDPTLTNVTFYSNLAGFGGAIANFQNSTPTISNSIFYENLATLPEDQNIFNIDDTSSANVTYSLVQGGYSGTGNINANPQFVNLSEDSSLENNFELKANSPAIDAGTNATVLVPTDFAGNSRIVNQKVDMGAYEYQEEVDTTPPKISVGNVRISEGDRGKKTAKFTVSLDEESDERVRVKYNTTNGTAKAGKDYEKTTGTLTFQPGQTEKIVEVPIIGDAIDEKRERFQLRLKRPENATFADKIGVGTIIDDDPNPSITIDNVRISEGNRGNKKAKFTVSLDEESEKIVRVRYNTTNGTARAGKDYEKTTGTLTFQPGQTEKTIRVDIIGDTKDEKNEKFQLRLRKPTNAKIKDKKGIATIVDND